MTRQPLRRRVLTAAQVGFVSALIASVLGPYAVIPVAADTWHPVPGTSWQWQLQGTTDISVNAQVFDIDMDVSASVVTALHGQGRKVICYVNVGAWENYRSDAGSFPPSVLGNVYSGYPNERWLDVRQISTLTPLMGARFDRCRQKGFDAVEPDNMDGYQQSSGFPLSAGDQINYNRWVADQVHARGMSVGLKNDTDQASQLQPNFEFAVSEECFQFHECDVWTPFLSAGKAVFEAEYSLDTAQFCPQAESMGISAIKKHLSLDSWRVSCGSSPPPPPPPPPASCDLPWADPGGAQTRVAAWSPARLDVFDRGSGGTLWHTAWGGGPAWGGPESQPGPPGGVASDPVAVSRAPNRLDVFALGGDGSLYHKVWTGSAWSDWEAQGNPGAGLTGQVTAAAWSADRLDLFARSGSPSQLWHKAWDGSAWSGWEAHGSPAAAVGDPTLVSWAAGRLDLFAVGSDGKLYHQAWPVGWDSWEGQGNPDAKLSVGSPAVAAWGANRLDIFAADVQNCGLWHKAWDGSSWSGWEAHGAPPGGLVSDPTAVSAGPGRLDVFVVTNGGKLWHEYWPGGWYGFEDHGRPAAGLTGRPAAVSWAPDRLDLFSRDSSGRVYHNAFDGYGPWGLWEEHGTP